VQEPTSIRLECPHCKYVFDKEESPEEVAFCPNCDGVLLLEDREILKFGQSFSHFGIIRFLGYSLYGPVYLANHIKADRLVLLRIISKRVVASQEWLHAISDPDLMEKNLHLANVLAPIKTGRSGEDYFQVSRYLNTKNPQTFFELPTLLNRDQVLYYAHSLISIIDEFQKKIRSPHGNINAGNIMLDGEEDVNIINMDIVVFKGDISRNQGEYVHIAPYYEAPEKIRHEQLNWSCDQYSLGATLYQMLVGVPPYEARTTKELYKLHVSGPFPAPEDRVEGNPISSDIAYLLQDMLGKVPMARFLSWKELQFAIVKLFQKSDDKDELNKKSIAATAATEVAPKPPKGAQTHRRATSRLKNNTGKMTGRRPGLNYRKNTQRITKKKKNFEYTMESTHSVAITKPKSYQQTVVSRPTNVRVSTLRAKNRRKSPVPLLIGIILGLSLLILIAVGLIKKKNETKAKQRYQDAIQYVTSMKNEDPPNFPKAIVELEYALAETKGTIYEKKLDEEYKAVKKLQADMMKRLSVFDHSIDALNEKISALDKELIATKNNPDGLDEILVKYKALPKILKKIKPVDDSARRRILKNTAKSIKQKIEKVNDKIAKRNQVRREKARVLAEEKRRAEMEARARKKAALAAAEKLKKDLIIFKENVVKLMNKTRILFIIKSQKGVLSTLNVPLTKGLPKGSLKETDIADITEEYNTWRETFKAIQLKAIRGWRFVAQSGEKFARTKILIGYIFYEIESIKEGSIKFKEKTGAKISKIKLNELNFKQFSQLLKAKGKKKRFIKDGTLGCYALSMGDFVEANKYIKSEDKTEFHNIMLAYLKYTLLTLSKTIETAESEKTFKKLTKKYHSIPEFKEAIEYVNKRTGETILEFNPPKKKKKR
jgi:serine/threonine protein kinase